MSELLYQIAVPMIPGIGSVNAKALISHCGAASAVFKTKKPQLLKIPGIGSKLAQEILNADVLKRAEKELQFIEKHQIQALFYADKKYPFRLKQCIDSPVVLYYKGNQDLNESRMIGIVGTRNATDYGKAICEKLIAELSPFKPLIISGLAYGIDICAHKSSLQNGLNTIGVLAHGLDRIYPELHRATAQKMLKQGGLITEFKSETNPDKQNFPSRNRIIAGLCSAIVVVEAAKNGGALITAELANSYSRDVFAFPGRINDKFSEGCNKLIKQNKAALISNAKDLIWNLGWEDTKTQASKQAQLFVELNADEQKLYDCLKKHQTLEIDTLRILTGFNASKIATLLLKMEFEGIVKSYPGKQYRLV